MNRRTLLASLAIVACALLAPSAAVASTPYTYHTVHARNAGASFNVIQGHYAIAVWVFTTTGRYSLKPGSAAQNSTSAYTDVEIIVQDLDHPMGKGYLEVAEWSGQVETAGRFHGALAGASVSAIVPVSDWHSGGTAVVMVNIAWTATARSVTRPIHWRVAYPRFLTILSNSNDDQRPATARGSVTFNGTALIANGVDHAAVLESLRYNCRQVGYRQSVDFGECTASNG